RLVSTLFPYTTLFRSKLAQLLQGGGRLGVLPGIEKDLAEIVQVPLGMMRVEPDRLLDGFARFLVLAHIAQAGPEFGHNIRIVRIDRKSTRLNSSHRTN